MGASNRGPSCMDCSDQNSPEECIGCSGYPSGTTFGFQGESDPPIINVPESKMTDRIAGWIEKINRRL